MRRIHFFFLLCLSLSGLAQKVIPPIEGWRVHLPYISNNTICQNGSKIYVGSPSGIFVYDEDFSSIEVLSRVNQLSDVEVKIVASDPLKNRVVVIYDNSNIDIIENGRTYNIPDILNQLILGKKNINNVSFYQNFAYLSCSFGIVVIDLDKKQIKDSYAGLGPNGTSLDIQDVTYFDNYFYASYASGIIRASINTTNLGDYANWSVFKTSSYSSLLTTFQNTLYAVVDSVVQTYDGISWLPYQSGNMRTPLLMELSAGNLIMNNSKLILIENASRQVKSYPSNALYGACVGYSGYIYSIGFRSGLIIQNLNNEIKYTWPQGPDGNTAQRMAYGNGIIWVAPGSTVGFGTSAGWAPSYNNNKFYKFSQNKWINFSTSSNPSIQNSRDFIDVSFHPTTKNTFMVSYGFGLFEIDNNTNEVINVFDSTNSSLRKFNVPGKQPLYVSGIDFDRNGNMWVSNFGAANPLSVRTASGQWLSVPFPTGADLLVGYVTCDDNNNKWVMSTRGNGIMLVNDGGNPLNLQGYQFKQLTKDETTGRLPSNTVICMTKDANGEMWVGTDQGLCIFSNPANAFSKEFGSRQIIIKTGLVNSIFLGTEPIYCIRVDAANRKWIGTRNGVWLVSEDGYTVIRNFNTKNSPLLSDVVYDICINGETGEVFFATEKGIISYAGTATDGTDKHGDVVVFPNPVRPEYTGLIAIRGLVQNANVKITDIAGNLVYETKANGGMATWDGRNFNGKRASTGVYIIYSSDKDGMETWAGKILFVN